MKQYLHRALVALGLFALACGGDTGVTPPPPPPPPPTVDRVTVVPTALTINVGATGQLQATALDAAGAAINGATFSYSSSAPAIASVSTLGTITAKLTGSAVITTTSGGKSANTAVTVQLAPVGNITLTVSRALLKESDTVSAVAVVFDEQNQVIVRPLTWASSDSSVAAVTPTGLILGLSAGGPVTITASAGGKSATVVISVIPANVAQVKLVPDTADMIPGTTRQIAFSATDEFGYPVVGRPVTWSSFNPNAATVDSTGLVTAVALGETTVIATVGGVSGQSLIRVAAVPPERFRIEVTNHLIYRVDIVQNGVIVGSAAGLGSATIERPLSPVVTLGWRMTPPNNRGEMLGETFPTVLNPTGSIPMEIDNVLDDGRVYYAPIVRNLSTKKVWGEFTVRESAGPCNCSLSPVDDPLKLGYWIWTPAAALQIYKDSDPQLLGTFLAFPVPLNALESRSGIWRLTLLVAP